MIQYYITIVITCIQYNYLLFLTFSALVASPKKLLYTVANPARGLLNRGKKKRKKKYGSAPHPPSPRAARSEKKKKRKKKKSRGASTCLGATQVGVTQVVSVRLASVQRFLRLVGWANGCRFAKFYASVCDCNFPSLVASLFFWRCLAASSSSFLHAAMNLRPPSVTASTQTSAFNAIAFQSPVMPNARMSLCTQSVHSFSFPPRPLRTTPSRFPNMIRFGNRPPLIRRSVPAHKSLLVRNVVSMLLHRVCYESLERVIGINHKCWKHGKIKGTKAPLPLSTSEMALSLPEGPEHARPLSSLTLLHHSFTATVT